MSQKPAAEVGVKLKVDSNAKEETSKIAAGLNRVKLAAGVTGSKLKGMGHTFVGASKNVLGGISSMGAMLAPMAGYAVAALGMGGLAGLALKSAHAFEESEAQARALAGTLTVLGGQGEFEEILEYANETKDELEEIAIQAGVTDDAMVAVFNDIIERGGKSIDAAKELTAEMAFAGRAIPGGAAALAQGFEQIQMGMVKAKSPLVAMIATTGTLKGTAKDVAKEMQKMSVDEQMKIAEKAISAMSKKMQTMPMTMEQAMNSISVVWGNIFETAGAPIMEQVTPVVNKIRQLFVDNADVIYEKAEAFGDAVGKVLTVAGPIVDKIAQAFSESWDQIQKAMEAITGPGQDFFEYIYENKDAFAETIGQAAKFMIGAATSLIRAFGLMKNVVGWAFSKLEGLAKAGVFGKDIAASVGENTRTEQTKSLTKAVTGNLQGTMSDDEFNKRRQEYIQNMVDFGRDAGEASRDFDTIYKNAMSTRRGILDQVNGAETAAMTDNAAQYAAAWNAAQKSGDKAAKEYVAKFLEGNESLANALGKEGPKLFEGGMKEFEKTLKQMGLKETADNLHKKMGPDMSQIAKNQIVQNFNGNINVKQDFRDQDPDRVAVVFKEELGKQATNRLSSRMAGAFGF